MIVLNRKHCRICLLRPGLQIGNGAALLPLGHSLRIDAVSPGKAPQALLTMLYRSTDRLCRCGAAVKNLSHSASLKFCDKGAPLNPGIKHLGSVLNKIWRRVVLGDSVSGDWRLGRGRRVEWLTDEEWARIEPLLPPGRKGAHRVDDRRVISGIVHMLKSGARWRDCPEEFGPYTKVYNRFNRWSRQGLWLKMFEALTGHDGIFDGAAIDATHIKAHRSAAGAKGGPSFKL